MSGRDYKKKVEEAVEKGDSLKALLLIHTAIEFYLKQWLYIIAGRDGKVDRNGETINKKLKIIDNYNFLQICKVHYIFNNFDSRLLRRLELFNKLRNSVHDLLIEEDALKVDCQDFIILLRDVETKFEENIKKFLKKHNDYIND